MIYQNGLGVLQDYVIAHMWFNLASAAGSTLAGPYRDALAASMTPAQIAEAQRLAREWKPNKEAK
jgi:TPR repeat protein